MILLRLTFGRICCGAEVRAGIVVAAAPVIRWSVGRPAAVLVGWVRARGGVVEEL